MSKALWVVLLGTIYVSAVRYFRFRRRNALLCQYNNGIRSKFKDISLQDAFNIQLSLAELEFPRIFSISVFFAIFKTYGIPSISSLLVSTGQLSDKSSSSKRAADTGILIVEAVLNTPGSERNLDAVARMNYLHERYRKAGKIRDADMLYTLSLFTLEPLRWTERYEWRKVTDLERCAMGTYWKALGDMMDIPFDPLPSSDVGWQDGLHWLEELDKWSSEYETQNMLPSDSNNSLAIATIEIALTNLPRCFHSTGCQLVSALLDTRLRTAMRLEAPSPFVEAALQLIMTIRKWTLRHLFLPRLSSFKETWFSHTPDPDTNRYHAAHYIDRPWYIKPTFKSRWSMISWLLWLMGGEVPSFDKPQNRPEGYHIAELGPAKMEGKGIEAMTAGKKILSQQVGKCPFPFHNAESISDGISKIINP